MSKESFSPHIVEAPNRSGGSLPTIDGNDKEKPKLPQIDNKETKSDDDDAFVQFLGKHEGKKDDKKEEKGK